MIGRLAALAVAASLVPSPAIAQASPWVVRVGPGRCIMERHQGTPAAMLAIETVPGSDTFRVAIATDGIGNVRTLSPSSLSFTPSRRESKGLASAANLPGSPERVIWTTGVSPDLLDHLAQSDGVTLAAGKATASFPLDKAPGAVRALRRCIADQLVAWGADAGQFAPGGAPPVSLKDRDGWLSPKDLIGIVPSFRESDLNATLRVGILPDGTVDDCHAVDGVPNGDVEKHACAPVLGKRLFTPAHDVAGRPVRGAATFTVRLMRR